MTNAPDRKDPTRRAVLGAVVAVPAAITSVAAVTIARSGSDADVVNLLDFIPRALHAGIVGRTVDNIPSRARALAGYIQTAIDTAAAQRRRLVVPAGLYNIAPIGTFAAEPGPCQRCLVIRSHMHIDAEAGATFRMVDGISTDAVVAAMCMFGSNEQLADLSWRGLTLDMNGQRNLISPERRSGKYSLLNQAHIFISGTPEGRAASATSVTVERCRFLNTPGVSCLVLAQSNMAGAKLGSGWRITDCDFIDGGLDTPDHSAIFAWADDVTCQRCTFANAVRKTSVGGNVAYEVHGSRHYFNGNTIRNYYQAVWIDGNKTAITASDIFIRNNRIENAGAYGIMFYGIDCHMRNVDISDNAVSFDDSVYDGVDIKIGIGCLAPTGQSKVTIGRNRITSQSRRTATSGVTLLAPSTAGQVHDDFAIDRNECRDTTFGVQVLTNATCGLGTISVSANAFRNLSRAGAFTIPQGVGVDFQGAPSPIRRLTIADNVCIDDRGRSAQCAFGVRVQGRIVDLNVAGNSASGMTGAAYAEGALVVASRGRGAS